jgi:hypothetical protein
MIRVTYFNFNKLQLYLSQHIAVLRYHDSNCVIAVSTAVCNVQNSVN